jgi:hypothetical protein
VFVCGFIHGYRREIKSIYEASSLLLPDKILLTVVMVYDIMTMKSRGNHKERRNKHMEYGDKFELFRYGVFRFRIDPIPIGSRTSNTKIHPGVRRIRTTHERKHWYEHKEYVRGRRSKRMLPNAWDDLHHAKRGRGWKRSKKQKQWS